MGSTVIKKANVEIISKTLYGIAHPVCSTPRYTWTFLVIIWKSLFGNSELQFGVLEQNLRTSVILPNDFQVISECFPNRPLSDFQITCK